MANKHCTFLSEIRSCAASVLGGCGSHKDSVPEGAGRSFADAGLSSKVVAAVLRGEPTSDGLPAYITPATSLCNLLIFRHRQDGAFSACCSRSSPSRAPGPTLVQACAACRAATPPAHKSCTRRARVDGVSTQKDEFTVTIWAVRVGECPGDERAHVCQQCHFECVECAFHEVIERHNGLNPVGGLTIGFEGTYSEYMASRPKAKMSQRCWSCPTSEGAVRRRHHCQCSVSIGRRRGWLHPQGWRHHQWCRCQHPSNGAPCRFDAK